MARRKYAKLKALMYENEVRQVDLIPVIGRKAAYIAERMNGHRPWNTQEIKQIADYLDIPKEQWWDYFTE